MQPVAILIILDTVWKTLLPSDTTNINSRNPHHPGYGLEAANAGVFTQHLTVAILIILDTVWKELVSGYAFIMPSRNPHHPGYGLEEGNKIPEPQIYFVAILIILDTVWKGPPNTLNPL